MDWVALANAITVLIKAIAWPIVILFGIYHYKPSISNLLNRITKGEAGPSGAKVEALAPNQLGVESPQKETEDQVKAISGNKGLPQPDSYLDNLTNLTIRAIERDFPDDLDAQKKWLIRILAVNMSQRAHEETHRLILGSQLMLLYKVNASGGNMTLEQVRGAYAEAAGIFPRVYKSFGFSAWLGFLKTRGLVEDIQFADQQAVSITDGGKSYLQYIIERQLPEKFGG